MNALRIKLPALAVAGMAWCMGAGADGWSWAIESAGFGGSRIAVKSGNIVRARYEVECDLSARDVGDVDEPEDVAPSVDRVRPDSHPAGLLAVVCPVGAHSARLSFFDPLVDSTQPVFTRTGSFFAHWELRKGGLWAIYDQPCEAKHPGACEIPFETVELPWP